MSGVGLTLLSLQEEVTQAWSHHIAQIHCKLFGSTNPPAWLSHCAMAAKRHYDHGPLIKESI